MKKSWLAVLLVPAIAYPATAWYLGAQIEDALATQYQQLGSQPYVKVVERQFERGLFSSRETVTLEFFPGMGEMLPGAGEGAQARPTAPRIRFLSTITHGPLAGGGLAAATMDSELVLDAEQKAGMAKLFGEQSPLRSHTVFRFDGSGTSQVTSPAFATKMAATAAGEPVSVVWDGLQAEMEFSANLARYTFNARAPKLDIEDGEGGRMSLQGLSFVADQQRFFPDEPLLYTGTQRLGIETIVFKTLGDAALDVRLGKLAYEAQVPASGEFFDVLVRLGAGVVDVGDDHYGPVHYDVSLKHLHARTYAKLYRSLLEIYGNPAALQGQADAAALQAKLAGPAMELLGHGPELSLDRLSFTTPEGEARLAAHARLPGVTAEDLNYPLMLVGKLEAGGELSLPEALLAQFAPSAPEAPDCAAALAQEEGECSGAADPVPVAHAPGRLEELVGLGYVTREGGMVKSSFTFKNGQLLVNNKPFDPMAMQ